MQPIPQGPPQGGPPPALLAMLAQHAAAQHQAAQGAGPAPGAPPPQLLALLAHHMANEAPPDQGPADADPHQPIRILQQMIQLGQEYQRVEPDAEDKATMAKVLSTLHQYLAKDQQDAEGALGGGSATRVLRKMG